MQTLAISFSLARISMFGTMMTNGNVNFPFLGKGTVFEACSLMAGDMMQENYTCFLQKILTKLKI